MKTSLLKLTAVKLQALWCAHWLRYHEMKINQAFTRRDMPAVVRHSARIKYHSTVQILNDPSIPSAVSEGSGTVSKSYQGCFCGVGN